MKKSEAKIYEEAKKQLEPLFSGFYPTSPQYRAFLQASEQLVERLTRVSTVLKTFEDSLPLPKSTKLLPRFVSILNASTYLFYVELAGSLFVDIALLLSIGRGQALHLEPDRQHRYTRHATSLEDIESSTLSLSAKLDFLESSGLHFFSKWFDTKLRNKIAHGDFDIDDSGNFFVVYAKGRRKKVDLLQKTGSFKTYYNAILSAFGGYLQDYVRGKDWKISRMII